MSSREPMWFCHECHAEMRPLMMPDPVCASCRGSFVEKIENTQDDPREFAHEDPGMVPPGHPVDDNDIFTNLQSLIDLGMRTQPGPRPPRPSGLAFQVHGPQGTRVIRIGGGPSPHEPDRVPTMSSFLGPSGFTPQPPSPGDRRGGIGAPLLAHYLMAMLGPHDPRAFGFPADGRMGDYVFNQEALDQIMTQLMENSNAHRPVPAPEDVVDKLPREVLVEGSATLQKDCAVCKETFSLTTEDPDEQVVITLPCKHPFHEPCILPWLKSSATCPVCRFALVPQPGQPTPPDASGSSGSGSSSSPPRPNPGYRSGPSTPPSDNSNNNNTRPPASPSGGGGGLFQNLYDTLTGHRHSNQNSRDRQRDREGEGDRDRGERDRHNDEQHSRTGQRNSPWSRSPTFAQPNPRRSSSDPRPERRTSPRNLDGSTGGTRSPPSNPYRPSSPSYPHGNNNSSRGNERRTSSRANNNNLPGSWGEELD